LPLPPFDSTDAPICLCSTFQHVIRKPRPKCSPRMFRFLVFVGAWHAMPGKLAWRPCRRWPPSGWKNPHRLLTLIHQITCSYRLSWVSEPRSEQGVAGCARRVV